MNRLQLLMAGALIAIGAAVGFAADPPATAPAAEIPTVKLVSPFDMIGRTNQLIAERHEDPIKTIVVDMGAATDLLTKFNTSQPVQPQQKAILGTLDELIAMLEKQPKNAKGGTNPNPTTPLPDSAVVGGKLTYGPMHDPSASTRMWGNLPPKQREQILQSQNEGFPAGYQSILSSYYRRLAQENVTGGNEPAAGNAQPATPPAPSSP